MVGNHHFYKGFQSKILLVFSIISNNPNFKMFLCWEGDTRTPLPNPTPESLYLVGNNRFYKGFQSEKVVFYSVSNNTQISKLSYVGEGDTLFLPKYRFMWWTITTFTKASRVKKEQFSSILTTQISNDTFPKPSSVPLYLLHNNRFYKGFTSEQVVFSSV